MTSYQFNIESDSDTEERDTGNYNNRAVVIGGGRVSYVKQEVQRSSAEKKIDRKPPTPPNIFKPADRMRPVSLPIENKHPEQEKKAEEQIPYTFKKIPWQLPKAPLDFPPPLDVPRVDAEKLASPSSAGDYTVVNPQKATNRPPPRMNTGGLGADKKNTRFCQFVKLEVNKDAQNIVSAENKCRNTACNFAHTMDAYVPLACTYQAACNNGDSCKFFHSNKETKFEYYIRSSLFPPPPARVQGQFTPQARLRK